MYLTSWHREGVNVEPFIGRLMLLPENSETLHRLTACPELGRAATTSVAAELNSPLCDRCWHWDLNDRQQEIYEAVQGVQSAETVYQDAEALGLHSHGFPLLVLAMMSVTFHSDDVQTWKDRQHQRMLEGYRNSFQGQRAVMRQQLGMTDEEGQPEKLIFVSQTVASGAVRSLQMQDRLTAGVHWLENMQVPGVLFQVPEPLGTRLYEELQAGVTNPSLVSIATLEESDTAKVLDTAAGLLEIGDMFSREQELFVHIGHVLEVARSV